MNNYKSQASSDLTILEDMQSLDERNLDFIERNHPAYDPVMCEVLKDAFNSQSSNRISKGEIRDWLNSLLD